MVRILKRVTSLVPLAFLGLAVCASAFGQAQLEGPVGGQSRYHVYLHSLTVDPGDLFVYARLDAGAELERDVVGKYRQTVYPLFVDGELAVFNGPVTAPRGGIDIGDRPATRIATGADFPRDQEAVYGPVLAIFNGPVESSYVAAGNGGRAVFNGEVTLKGLQGLSAEGRGEAETSLTFQGPVSVLGGLSLKGRASAVFLDEVKVGRNVDLTDPAGRASLTVDGRGRIFLEPFLKGNSKPPEGFLKVSGGNRLIFSLSPSMAADGFIKAEAAEIDADCLVIDNPDNVLEEGEEVILITGGEIKLNGDKRKIVTKQKDEFELLVSENQISAKLIKNGRRYEQGQDALWGLWGDDDADMVNYIGMQCANGGVCGNAHCTWCW